MTEPSTMKAEKTLMLPRVKEFDWSAVSPDMVRDADLFNTHPWAGGLKHSLAYYLGHFHKLANAVRDEDPDRGFIDISVWRPSRANAPHNARIMENIFSLVWFFTKKAEWNPYYADDALRQRIEAAIEYWASLQHVDGMFSESGYEKWNMASTAFAAKFMGEALVLFDKTGVQMGSAVHRQLKAATRKAMMRVLKGDDIWSQGCRVTNQYTAAFAGALAYLHVYDDDELEAALEKRMLASQEKFNSPAGYAYEADGADWSYYFGTYHSNVQMIWHYGRNRSLKTENTEETFGNLVKKECEDTIKWLSYNALPQPDGKIFILNRSFESRGCKAAFERVQTPLAEVIPLVRAFSITEDERQEKLAHHRRQLEREWSNPPPLETEVHMGFSPYAFLHHDHATCYPDKKQRDKAKPQLPYLARENFVHQRVDDRYPNVYTFIRRPSYYAAFNNTVFAKGFNGLGLLWQPGYGTLLQSHSRQEPLAWGAFGVEKGRLSEQETLEPSYIVDGEAIEPQSGAADLPDGEFEILYPMYPGWCRLRFNPHNIEVVIKDYAGKFIEQIPLLLSENDELTVAEEGKRLELIKGNRQILSISFNDNVDINVEDNEEPLQTGGVASAEFCDCQKIRPVVIKATATKSISYRFNFSQSV